MARVTVEDCLKNVDSRFTLVHLAVRRVLQLRGGAPLTMENVKGNKEVVMALREIAAEKVTVDNIREIEESRPAPVELPPGIPDQATAAADLKEIMEEAASLAPVAELSAEGLTDIEPEAEQTRDEEEI
jgi:DNA-directed RNA polymerase subunit omega